MAQEKTVQEHLATATKYALPSEGVGGAIALLLWYFFEIPTNVAIAVTVVVGFVFNMLMVLVKKR